MRYSRMVVATSLVTIGCGGSGSSAADDAGTPNPPNPPQSPTLHDDIYEALAGATVLVDAAHGITANDVLKGSAFAGFDGATNHGSIKIAANGSFAYTPDPEFSGTDTFEYEIGGGHATASFTVERRALFVDNQAPSGGDGTQAAPFDGLALALNAANQVGDVIFVFAGDGTNTGLAVAGDIVLATAGLTLIGEGVGLATAQGTIVPAGDLPLLTGRIVVTGDRVTVAGLRSTGGPGGVRVHSANGVTIRNNRFTNPINRQSSVDLDNVAGAIEVSHNVFSHGAASGDALHLVQSVASAQYIITKNTFTATATVGNAASGKLFSASFNGSAQATLTMNENASTGPGPGQGWQDLWEMVLAGSANLTMTATQNTFDGGVGKGIHIDPSESSVLNATFVNNFSINVGGAPIFVNYSNASSGTLVLRGTTTSGVGPQQIRTLSSAPVKFALRDNVFRSTGGVSADITLASVSPQSLLCVDFTNNDLGSLILSRQGTQFDVEQATELDTLNALDGTVQAPFNAPSEVADGTCGIP